MRGLGSLAGSAGVQRWEDQQAFYSGVEGDSGDRTMIEALRRGEDGDVEKEQREQVSKEVRSILEAAFAAAEGQAKSGVVRFETMIIDLLAFHIEDLSLFVVAYHSGDAAWISEQLVPLGPVLLSKRPADLALE